MELTAMKSARLGGHAHGILTTTPAAFLIPSQSPVPVGFRPAGCPKSGTRAGSTARLLSSSGTAAANAVARDSVNNLAKYFMVSMYLLADEMLKERSDCEKGKEC